MSTAQEDLYAALDVARTATPTEIESAYFRKVRKHPPHKDPEGFRRIQTAYDVLRQPATRKEYDDTSRTDPEARTLFDAGRKLLEDGKAAEALPLIKRALVRQPESPVVRDLLTQALLATKAYDEAEKQARRVLALEPDNPTYSARVGDVLRDADRDAEALPYYRKAVFLDRTNSQNVIRLALLLNYLDQQEDAIKLLEQEIRRDGKVDFDDLTYFQCLYTICTLRERYDDIEAIRRRVREILPPDPDQRSYVAWFYYENALRMANLGNFEAAVRSIEEAGTINSDLPDLARTRATLGELPRLHEDKSLDVGLRMTAASLAQQRLLGHNQSAEELFDKASDLLDKDIATQGANIGAQVRLLESRFPTIAAALGDLLAKIRELDAKVPKIYVRLTCPSCGERGRTDRPTIQNLQTSGFSASLAATVLRTQGERGALQLLRFTCNACKTDFDGLSNRVVDTPTPAQPQAQPSSGCFVVTATYGDENAYAVAVLRAYRDYILGGSPWGQLLIRLYRVIGPVLARCIASSAALREPSRRLCERLARRAARELARRGYGGYDPD